MTKYLTLPKWAEQNYERVPTVQTLQRWARNGNIYPAPQIHGREYKVLPSACYVSTKKTGAKSLENPRQKAKTNPLLEKLKNDKAQGSL
ncbi:excisionase [Enterobacteriaceae bacterium ML5]|nr:excisionase [Enterobacteriaceae bacterium ML5]